jgi:hypothetical protein
MPESRAPEVSRPRPSQAWPAASALRPRWIVAGHKNKDLDDDADCVIDETRQYLDDADDLLDERQRMEKAVFRQLEDKLVKVFGRHVERIRQGGLNGAG